MTTITADDRATSPHPKSGRVDRFSGGEGRGALTWIIAFFGFLAAAGSLYASYRYFYPGEADGAAGHLLVTPVKQADLLMTVTEDGNVESADNVELKCKVPGPITILEIVPDGSHVKKGDLLVRLDSSSIEDSILTQEIAVAKAEAAKISSEKDFSAAKIAVDEYQQGTFRRELRQAEADIVVARQDLATAENQLRYSRKMHRKGYVTDLDVQSKEFAVEQAKLNMEVSELTKEVLEKFSKAKTMEELISKRDSAEALMNSEIAAFTKETNQLKRLQSQLEDCTITARQDGMVVYANDRTNPFQQGPKIDLGAQVNQFQVILRLPDLKKMQVKALVHETKVDQLHVGMRSRIEIQDRQFQGEITSIANQPEASNWFNGNVKEYATLIRIDGEPDDLKPGMTAELEILVNQKKGVLQVPVQCVVERANKFHAYVKTRGGVEPRELVLGGTNDTVIEVVDGLKEGELVLLNPRADVPDATDHLQVAEEVDISKRYGDSQAKPEATKATTTGPAVGGGAAAAAPQAGAAASPATVNAGSGQSAAASPAGAGGFKWPTFKDLDKDGDGKLTREESPSPGFDQTDSNSDGFIDRKEFKTAVDKFKKMMAEQGGDGLPGAPGSR
ncbi:MAG TPA: HlyD family efflux transporter periplasmic adaptor subunit [Pirellulales bacterium]|nr:HlyD family efflux transporter periplasmic adaptor subunit [Pirellulales bacterium]